MTKEEDLAIYLKSGNFECFIHAWHQKYYSLGHLGDFIINKKIEISYVQLMKYLNKTRFENVDFLEVLNLIYGKKIESKREKREKQNQLYREFQLELLTQFPGTKAFIWL